MTHRVIATRQATPLRTCGVLMRPETGYSAKALLASGAFHVRSLSSIWHPDALKPHSVCCTFSHDLARRSNAANHAAPQVEGGRL